MTDIPGVAHFDASDTPEDIERKMAAAFAPVRAMAEGLRRAEQRLRIEHYRQHPPRDDHGRFVSWEAPHD